ncbi:2Fe-2S iron-sulfur cluster-binding protein [Streptomyces sp. HUAS TT20]|uniref:2Fe-2S iron-sulfur cluster-binding protein n=1 Tax=Streptomyces sp. HUAS TT20 TaxID=3447509 RepID=UPI0021D9B185|nr:2Fe-2S iron-sulfur cluster-binding protein [Streptomyces sp. HUAS 15-9]UXY27878.1 2Fe-2S iron-sulfur cluster-binding protein [Streptomyces sp. HUAS 15-9]
MTDDQHGEGASRGRSRWDPLPQGDYDDGATAFVKLPEGGIDALLAGDTPLAAPGHGYVPPQIAVAPGPDAVTDPGATGTWAMPADGAQWPDPNAVPQEAGADDRFAYNPMSTQQWTFDDPAAATAPGPGSGHDVTGQWSIPVAGGDLPDESGEFTTSSLVEQWGGTPPATLPGGAPAPWATEGAGQPWGQQTADPRAGETRAGTGQAVVDHPDRAPRVGHPEPPADHDTGSTATRAVHDADGPAAPGEEPDADHASRTAPAYAAHEADGTSEPAEDAEPAAGIGAEDAHGVEEAPEGATGSPAGDAATADAEPAPEARETAATGDDDAAARDRAPAHDDHPLASFVLRVNGVDRPVTDAWIGESLLYVLRERLGLAGAKDGCSQGECGACNVQVDGRLVASCLVPAVTAAGSEVRTVEGLAVDGQPSDVQRALAKCGAVQCGFCAPGMAMTVHDLLEGNPAPTDLEARQALCGNLCRCSGYRGVLDAVQDVVAEREAHAAADAETDAGEARIPHQAGPGAGGVNPSAFEASGPPVPHDQSYGQGQSYGQDQSFGGQDQSFGGQDQSYGGQDQSYGGQDQSYGGQDQSYGGQDQSYGGQDQSYGGQDQSYGQDGGQA